MDEVPHRVVIHLETTLGQLGHQSAQGEGFLPDPVHKPGMVLGRDCLGLVPAHLARRHTPGLPEAPNPGDRRVDPNAEPRRRRAPRQTLLLNCCNHTLMKINRIRLCHPCWPPSPASMLNQIRPTRGIPNRIGLMSSRSSRLAGVTRGHMLTPWRIQAMALRPAVGAGPPWRVGP